MDSRDFEKEVAALTVPSNIWLDIVSRQISLMNSYKTIEKWPITWPVNLNHKESQLLIKDMLARTVEELAESYEAFLLNNLINTLEELADALHFLTETIVLSDCIPNYDIITEELWVLNKVESPIIDSEFLAKSYWNIAYFCNLTRNALRNKPWKQSQMLYDHRLFESHLIQALRLLIHAFGNLGCSSEKLWFEYTKKNEVNKFRISSKY